MEYIKWSWKAIIAFFGPIVVLLIESNQETIETWIIGLVTAVLAGVVTWFKNNGPDPR